MTSILLPMFMIKWRQLSEFLKLSMTVPEHILIVNYVVWKYSICAIWQALWDCRSEWKKCVLWHSLWFIWIRFLFLQHLRKSTVMGLLKFHLICIQRPISKFNIIASEKIGHCCFIFKKKYLLLWCVIILPIWISNFINLPYNRTIAIGYLIVWFRIRSMAKQFKIKIMSRFLNLWKGKTQNTMSCWPYAHVTLVFTIHPVDVYWGRSPAESTVALMRSRYTAYTMAKITYIQKTMRGNAFGKLSSWRGKTLGASWEWEGLRVPKVVPENEQLGYVEFIASFREDDVPDNRYMKWDLSRLRAFGIMWMDSIYRVKNRKLNTRQWVVVMTISYDDFEKVDFRSGTVVKVEPFERARNRLTNWRDLGVLQTSALYARIIDRSFCCWLCRI